MKKFLIGLVLVLTMSALAGCGQKEEAEPVERAVAADPEEGRGDVIEEENPLAEVDQEVNTEYVYTGYDTNGYIGFTIVNNSPYEIYAAKVGSTTSAAENDIDILPAILSAGESYTYETYLKETAYNITDWTIQIEDTDGVVSQQFDTFNAWNLEGIVVDLDKANGGYVCEFFYRQEEVYDPNTSPLSQKDENIEYHMAFTVYNETPWEILTIQFGPRDLGTDYDIDILGNKTLPVDGYTTFDMAFPEESTRVTSWTIYITDVDGDTSSIYEEFNPWTVSYIDIKWDANTSSYYCDFQY